MLILYCVLVVFSAQYVVAETTCPPIITKKEWDGLKEKRVKNLNPPVELVIIQHTVTQSCSDDKACAEVVRDLQKIHMEKAFLWDIAPSFLIAGTGKVYEGRGWNRVAVHTTGFNNQSIGIAFIGTFNNQEPTKLSLEAAKALIQCGVESDRLKPNYKVVAHNQLLQTESPGKRLLKSIMSWSNWAADVSDIKKMADKDELQSKDDSQPRSDTQMILATPKQIDMFSNLRDVIAELIANLSKIAQLGIKTAEDFSKGLNDQFNLFIKTLADGIQKAKESFFGSLSTISSIPGAKKCVQSIESDGNNLFDETETKAKECADQRVKELDDKIKNLSNISSSAINFSNTAVENTRNCTEEKLGIAAPTKACLNSVTKQTESFTNTYESQRKLAVESIQVSLKALPAALELCSKKYLDEALLKSTKLVSSATSKCSTAKVPFGFGK